MKVCLVATHQLSLTFPVYLYECLGVLALAASLHDRLIDFEVLDLVEFNDLSKRDFDNTIEAVAAKIILSNPTVLGLSTMSYNLIIALEICTKVKEKLPSLFTILGGPGVSFCAQEVLSSFSEVDAIIRGEADRAFPNFIKSMNSKNMTCKIPGLVYRIGNNIVDHGWPDPIEQLDSLPIPMYELCQNSIQKYTQDSAECEGELSKDREMSVSLEAGRGCPFGCIFCSTSAFFKRKYRLKSVDRIMAEISHIRQNMDADSIIFNHDLLTFDQAYVEELCNTLQKQIPSVRWTCSVRLDTINADLLRKMRKSGCEKIFLGIEVATARMQDVIKKRLDLTRFENVLRTLIDLDYKFTLSFIVGIPGEEQSDTEAILSHIFFAKSLDMDRIRIQIHPLNPELGSLIYEKWRNSLNFDDYGNPGHSDIPLTWSRQIETIKKHPEIFAPYFHITTPSISRENVLKYAYLALLIETYSSHSLQQAYRVLGEKLPLGIVRNIAHLKLPKPNYPDIQFDVLMESVRQLVGKLFGEDDLSFKKYDAIAQYEIASFQVFERKSDSYLRIIEVYFDPSKLIDNLREKEKDVKERKRFLLLFWDQTEKEVKCAEVPEKIAEIIYETLKGSDS